MTDDDDSEYFCRICGYGDGSAFWEDGWPTSVICDCCGTESGVGDMGEPGSWDGLSGIRNYRGYWVGNGAQWHSSRKPKDWDLLEQLSHIPPQWR
ncbi:hypothetical protein [Streptomyces sp. PR69]|uniref:hypothetical protein n=1 Tax=Streptomyces sp. PR69 TaxID=2984950 RepID=UPI0022641017|nr:hypothetical protein [Streptomyces sp. PR69]